MRFPTLENTYDSSNNNNHLWSTYCVPDVLLCPWVVQSLKWQADPIASYFIDEVAETQKG